MYNVLALSPVPFLSLHPQVPTKIHTYFLQSSGEADLEGWLLALMPHYILRPTLDIRVWMERKAVDWSSGPQCLRTEPWSLDGSAGE